MKRSVYNLPCFHSKRYEVGEIAGNEAGTL